MSINTNASPNQSPLGVMEPIKSDIRQMVYEYLAMEGLAETFSKMQVY